MAFWLSRAVDTSRKGEIEKGWGVVFAWPSSAKVQGRRWNSKGKKTNPEGDRKLWIQSQIAEQPVTAFDDLEVSEKRVNPPCQDRGGGTQPLPIHNLCWCFWGGGDTRGIPKKKNIARRGSSNTRQRL